MGSPKLLLLALDSGDRHSVRTWATQGHLPTIARLLEAGRVVPITTPTAVLESAVWPTCLTGASADRHGMFGWEKIKLGSYEMESAMDADRLPFPPFWAHLCDAGVRVVTIDVPFSRPLPELGGTQVVNWGAHDGWAWERSSWPPPRIDDLVGRFGDHPIGSCDLEDRTLDDYEDLRVRLLEGVRKKAALLRHCRDADDWDFFFGVFSESHCAGHQLWHFMDPGHPWHDPDAPLALRTALRDVYRAIDDALASLLEGLGPDVHVALLLSHGMGPAFHGSHLLESILERWAGDEAGSGSLPIEVAHRVGRALWSLRHVVPPPVREAVERRLSSRVRRLFPGNRKEAPHPRRSKRAFALAAHTMTGGIRINLRGREPAGLVEPGRDYDALCEDLSEALLGLVNADTGRPAVQWVARADRLYRGPHRATMPDLFVEWDHLAPIRSVHSPRIGVVSRDPGRRRSGEHRDGGLLIGLGPRFGSGEAGAEMRTQDLAPTILDFFGVQSPPTSEGRAVPSLLGEARRYWA